MQQSLSLALDDGAASVLSEPRAPWLWPAIALVSLAAHVAAFSAAAWLPERFASLRPEPAAPAEWEMEVASIAPEPEHELVPEPEPEIVPEPEPDPVVAPAALAVVPRPRPEPEIVPEPEPAEPEPVEEAPALAAAEPPPAEEETPEPLAAPAPEVLTSTVPGVGTWSHRGEAGASGTGGAGRAAGRGSGATPVAAVGPSERGLSRAELRRLLLEYVRNTLGRHINREVHYPLAARRERLEGVVVLRVRLDRGGRLLAVRLGRTSGHSSLDQAALDSLGRMRQLPAPPRQIPWDDSQELPLPVTYQLDR